MYCMFIFTFFVYFLHMVIKYSYQVFLSNKNKAQSTGVVEYSDCFTAEWLNPTNECSGYDTKQSGGEIPVMPGLWGMWSTPSLSLLPGPH